MILAWFTVGNATRKHVERYLLHRHSTPREWHQRQQPDHRSKHILGTTAYETGALSVDAAMNDRENAMNDAIRATLTNRALMRRFLATSLPRNQLCSEGTFTKRSVLQAILATSQLLRKQLCLEVVCAS